MRLICMRHIGVTAVLCLMVSQSLWTALASAAWADNGIAPALAPEVVVGERLFLETRFSYSRSPTADPVMASLERSLAPSLAHIQGSL